jgi:hypothetical protein
MICTPLISRRAKHCSGRVHGCMVVFQHLERAIPVSHSRGKMAKKED